MVPGADVSHHHPIRNWGLASQNIRFLGAKATEGSDFVDPTLGVHLAGFRASSLDLLMLYHVCRPGDPRGQAQFLARTVGPLQPHERLVLDLERSAGVDFAFVDTFFGELMGNGHDPLIESVPGLYASKGSWDAAGGPPDWDLAKYVWLWVPKYGAEPDASALPGPWTGIGEKFWQDSQTAQIPGIDCSNGGCDANWWLGSQDELTAFAA
jgi:GH25 family lysozyme M1 (1,4-beta-N-acetylmuramidase)